jgi:hypothetical protein
MYTHAVRGDANCGSGPTDSRKGYLIFVAPPRANGPDMRFIDLKDLATEGGVVHVNTEAIESVEQRGQHSAVTLSSGRGLLVAENAPKLANLPEADNP